MLGGRSSSYAAEDCLGRDAEKREEGRTLTVSSGLGRGLSFLCAGVALLLGSLGWQDSTSRANRQESSLACSWGSDQMEAVGSVGAGRARGV